MSRAEAERILRTDLPADMTVRINVDSSGHGEISIFNDDISDKRTFDLSDKLCYEGMMLAARQNTGLGRTVMRNEIEFLAACGVETFHIRASSDAGAYTWARFGFLLQPYVRDIQKEVRHRFEAIKPLLTADEIAALSDKMAFKNPTDLWDIADSRIDIAPRLSKLFHDAAHDKQSARAYNRIKNLPSLKGKWSVAARAGAPVMPSGRVLLAKGHWYGILDTNNAQQMDRVAAYAGGWKNTLKR